MIGIHISVGPHAWFKYNDLYFFLSNLHVLVLIPSVFSDKDSNILLVKIHDLSMHLAKKLPSEDYMEECFCITLTQY